MVKQSRHDDSNNYQLIISAQQFDVQNEQKSTNDTILSKMTCTNISQVITILENLQFSKVNSNYIKEKKKKEKEKAHKYWSKK